MNTIKKRELKKAKFLEVLKDEKVLGNVSIALTRSGLKRTTMYKYRKEDDVFAGKWDKIVIESDEKLADEAEFQLRKALLKGNITAIIFTLKNKRPGSWRDRKEISGVGGKAIPVSMPKTEKWLRKLLKNEKANKK